MPGWGPYFITLSNVLCSLQDGFINFIVRPLFEAFVSVFPGTRPLMLGIEANGRYDRSSSWDGKDNIYCALVLGLLYHNQALTLSLYMSTGTGKDNAFKPGAIELDIHFSKYQATFFQSLSPWNGEYDWKTWKSWHDLLSCLFWLRGSFLPSFQYLGSSLNFIPQAFIFMVSASPLSYKKFGMRSSQFDSNNDTFAWVYLMVIHLPFFLTSSHQRR